MNWLLKYEMRSINVKTSLTVLFISVFFGLFGQTRFSDTDYYRGDFKTVINKNNTFSTNDTILTTLSQGKWSLSGDTLTLKKDSITENIKIVYSSENKVSFLKNQKRISYHDYDSFTGKDKSWITIVRGVFGLIFLFLIAFLFSKNKRKLIGQL